MPATVAPSRALSPLTARSFQSSGAFVRSEPGDSRRAILAIVIFLVGALASLPLDLAAARVLRTSRVAKSFDRPLRYGEAFGHALGAALLLVGIALVDVRRRRCVPRIATAAFGSGLAANLMKMIVMRSRPNSVPVETASVLSTFGEWFPGPHAPSAWQSFPSAHSALAVGLSVALAAYYPRGRWLVGALAGLCVLHRMASGAHFASDVCVGAAIGWGVASLCLRATPFDRLESACQ